MWRGVGRKRRGGKAEGRSGFSARSVNDLRSNSRPAMKSFLVRLVLAAAGCGFGGPLAAQVALTIVNPGFEANTVTGPQAFDTTITPTGWTTYDPTGVLGRDYSDVGVLKPGGTSLYAAGAPEGNNVAIVFLWPQNAADDNRAVGLQQTLAATLQAATRYTFSVQVGNIASDGSGSYSLSGFPGYRVELLAGATLLAQDQNAVAPADGFFSPVTIEFTTGGSPAGQGEAITIRLLNLGVPNSGIEVNFDDVRLTATAIPEPAAGAAVAAVAALGVAWRRRGADKNRDLN